MSKPISTARAGRAVADWCDVTVDARSRRSAYLGAVGRDLAAAILGRPKR